jgi:nitrous oxidase accessory protein NosD
MSQQLKNIGSLFLAMAIIASAAIATGVFLTFQPRTTLGQTNGEGDLCGNTIMSTVHLTSDQKCGGDGIKVQGNNIIMNLNGFTVRGPGADSNTTGIFIDGGSTVRIKGPGIITGFGNGIEFSNAGGGSMRDVYVGNNDIGVLLDAVQDTQIKQNHITDNRIGFLIQHSDNPEIENAEMARNDEGIRIENTRSVDVDFNNIMDGKTGLYIDSNSTRTEIFYNVIFRNNVTDVSLVGNAQSNSSENLYDNNQCSKSNPPQICQGGSSAQSDRLQEALKRRAEG